MGEGAAPIDDVPEGNDEGEAAESEKPAHGRAGHALPLDGEVLGGARVAHDARVGRGADVVLLHAALVDGVVSEQLCLRTKAAVAACRLRARVEQLRADGNGRLLAVRQPLRHHHRPVAPVAGLRVRKEHAAQAAAALRARVALRPAAAVAPVEALAAGAPADGVRAFKGVGVGVARTGDAAQGGRHVAVSAGGAERALGAALLGAG